MELDMITTSEQLVEHALKEYESPLIGFAISIVRDHDRVRDVVQDTFIRLYKQDVEKVRHLLKESGGDQDLVKQLPTLGPGQFQMVAPDVDPAPVPIQCRWLYTDHGPPLNEDQVEDVTSSDLRAWAKARSAGKGRARGKDAAVAASRGSSWSEDDGNAEGLVESARLKSVGGMTAAAQGIVDDY